MRISVVDKDLLGNLNALQYVLPVLEMQDENN